MPVILVVPGVGPISFARYVEHDPKSLEYPAAAASGPLTSVDHGVGPVLDQGQLGSCTGNSLAGNLNTRTIREATGKVATDAYLGDADAVDIYQQATRLDRVPGVYPPVDTGSTGLAATKAARKLGYFKGGYSHAFGVTHAVRALQLHPISVGTGWTQAMFTPDKKGYVAPATADEEFVGGHEWLAYGWDEQAGDVLCVNSWGRGWGLQGLFRVRGEVLGWLLKRHGDAVALAPAGAS